MPVVIMVVATALAALWMRYSPRGRAIYATGGNAEAARLCGVDPQRTVVMVFAHPRLFRRASRRSSTRRSSASSSRPRRPGLELTIITASVVGGVSILGGVGTVVGSTLAAILIAEITSALVFINVSPYWTDAVRGGADPRDRHRRHPAPPAPRGAGMEEMSAVAETSTRRAPRWLMRHETLLAIILVVALIGLGAFNDRFLTLDNLLNQGRLMTEIGLIALPMTFVIITGGIDLSVGAIVGLCAIMLGYSWKTFGFPLPLAIVFALGVGALAGFVNGLVITRLKVPPLIMTIATLALYRGLAEGISQAHSVRGYPEWFYVLGQGDVFGVPTQLWSCSSLIVIAGVALDRTTFGRTLYAIGANETAARFSALTVDRTKLIVYTLSGLASGLAALVLVSRVTTTRLDMGHRLRARRDRGGGARRNQHFRRLRHDLGHRDRPGDDPAAEERSGADGGQGRRDDRRDRRGADRSRC